MKNRFWGFGIALFVILAFSLTACGELEDDARIVIDLSGRPVEEEEGSLIVEGEPIGEADFQLMGWYWEKQISSNETFEWNFKNDGTVSVVHCCLEEITNQFSYFLDGDILFTYGSEMSDPEAEIGKITFTEENGVVKLIRESGAVFIRRGQADPVPGFRETYPKPRKPLGTWRNNDAEFIFSDNDGLLINSLSEDSALRPGQYRYLAKAVDYKNYLAIYGPIADGETADVWRYGYSSTVNSSIFSQSSSTLVLTSLNKDGINYQLARGGVK